MTTASHPVVDAFEVDRALLHVGDQGREDQVAFVVEREVIFLAGTFLRLRDHEEMVSRQPELRSASV